MSTSGIIQDLWDGYRKNSGRRPDQVAELDDPVARLIAAVGELESLVSAQKGPPNEQALTRFYEAIAALDAAVARFFQVLDGFVAADERQFKANAIGGQITLKSLIPQWQEQDRLFGGNLQAALQDLMMTAQTVFFPNPTSQG